MDNIKNIIVTKMDDILIGIIVALIGGLIGVLFKFLPKIIVVFRNIFLPQSLLEPKEKAVYLNLPQVSIYDRCIGREYLLQKVFTKIINSTNTFSTKNSISINGVEGIGKTLFCYTLFNDYLRKYPIFLGWIECNGEQSIFSIIRNSFKDIRFYRKSKNKILDSFKDLNKPCILFVDQVDQTTLISELEELSNCPNVILIISGRFKRMNFVDYSFTLPPLSNEVVYTIFEQQSDENIKLMDYKSKKSVYCILQAFVRGNPFLAKAVANAKYHYSGKWEYVQKRIQEREYDEEDYIKNVLRQLYKIDELEDIEKDSLSKLSTIQYTNFTESVFELLGIPKYCVDSLCNTYWLTQKDDIIYSMDNTHRDVITKVLMFRTNLENTIESINKFMFEWEKEDSNEFKCISIYVENILKTIQGYARYIEEKEIFSKFVYYVASKYKRINKYQKCIEWIELCKPKDANLSYDKLRVEFQAKSKFANKYFSFSEIEQIYFDALEKASVIEKFEDKKRFLMQEYCNFLIINERYNDALLLCREYWLFRDNGG